MPKKDQRPASDPRDHSAPRRGVPEQPQQPQQPQTPEQPQPPVTSPLGEVRDYLDWLENQRPAAGHARARAVIVFTIIALLLSVLAFLWWRS